MKKQVDAKLIIVAMTIAAIFMLTFSARAQSDKMPAPDFSEMEKDYEIIKWSYQDSGYIRLVIKPKHDPPQEHKYGFKFFDEDGVTIDGPKIIFNSGYSTPAGEVEKGEAYAPDEAGLRKVKSVIVYRVLSDGTLIGPKPSAAPGNNPTAARQPQKSPAAQAKTDGEALLTGEDDGTSRSAQSGDCNYTAQPALGGAGKFSEATAKSALYERYSFEKDTGDISSPAAVGVTFLDIKLLGSYANTVTVVPGRGAQRKHDGAPVGAAVYRFHAKYVVCRKYSDSTRRTQYESDNVCFKAKNGNWDCPVDSVPQITELN